MLRRILMILLWLVLLGGGFVFYWIQDANRFKPELENLIQEQAGVQVKINGDLSWRLFPPISLTAAAVTAMQDGQQWSAERLALDLDVMTILRTRDVNQWRIQALTLNDVTMADDTGKLGVAELRVRDFAIGTPAPVNASLTYTPMGAKPIPLQVKAAVTYQPEPEHFTISDADFATDMAAGVCNLDASPVTGAKPAPAPKDGDLIPVEIWRGFDWQGQCDLERLTVEDQRFNNVTLQLANAGGAGENVLRIPEFFGGSAVLTLAVDAKSEPIRWTLKPDLKGVDSQQLTRWLDPKLHWIAPLAYGGTLQFQGNTPAELMASVSGETSFDGGQGAISITRIKEPLLAVAKTLRESDEISRWPDIWNYERLVGHWRVDRQHHNLDLALDNLTVAANGDYDVAKDQMDIVAELTFKTLSEGKMFDMSPLLMDLPIPVRCRGTIEDPKCAVDDKAAKQLAATMLTSKEGTPMREKLDAKIDKEVPEQYRDAARSLLDMLGGALDKDTKEQ